MSVQVAGLGFTGVNGTTSSSTNYGANPNSGRLDLHKPDPSSNSPNSNPRRRLMAIQELLNPSDKDVRVSVSPSVCSEPAFDGDNRTLRLKVVSRNTARPSRVRGRFGRARLSPSVASRSSRSTLSPDVPVRRRSFRPAYNQEMADFIWFLKVDQNRPWDEILTEYNSQFSEDHRDKSGLQCKYYRHIKSFGITRTRAQQRTAGGPSPYGMMSNTRRRYSWMERYA